VSGRAATGAEVTADAFAELFAAVRTWGRWGEDDQRGALHHVTPERVVAAARLVQQGTAVTLRLPLNTRAEPDNPQPAEHQMTMLFDRDIGSGSLRFSKDYVGVDYHNDGHSHLDALCHVAYEGSLYNGLPQGAVSAAGSAAQTVDVLAHGLVGRGVLLDIPAVRGVPSLEPGEHIFAEDLEAAEAGQGVAVAAGDILLVRTGHARRLRELGPWDTIAAKAGLHPTAARFLAEREIAALGSDGNSDTAPSSTQGVAFPIHVLALNAMGVHLLDYLQFEDLPRSARGQAAGTSSSSPTAAHTGGHGLADQPDRDLLSGHFLPFG
jgi:kynurenine formamidase